MTEARSAKTARRVTVSAAILAGAITVSTAIGTLVVAVQTHNATVALSKGQEEIHVLVNKRLSEALAKIARLELRLAQQLNDASGIEEARKSILEAERQITYGETLKRPEKENDRSDPR